MARFLILALYDYADKHGGAQKLACEQAEYLIRKGHEVWLLAQDPTGVHPPYRVRDDLHILLYPSPNLRLFDPKRQSIHQDSARALVRQYMTHPPDVVHGHILLPYDGMLDLFANAKYVYTVHSPVKLELQAGARGQSVMQRVKSYIASQLTHGIEKRVLTKSHIVTSDSAYTKRELTRLHGQLLGDKTQVVAGWIDKDHFFVADNRDSLKYQLGIAPDTPFLFTLRRLEPRNGVDMLLYALKMVHDAGHDFQMMIGGGGSQKERLIALRNSLGLADKVTFLGRVSDDDLPRWYAACDVFLLPTHTLECFGIITLEAFASGRPVIATPVGAIPEVIQQIEPAWLSDDNSASAFAQKIVAYLRGELPAHPPQTLRDFVIHQYDQDSRLSAFERMLLA